MSTSREQYDAMLDDLPDESKVALVNHVPFAKLLEDVDPTAYRCGCNDFQPICDECGDEFWADDPDDEAVCAECREEAAEAERESGEGV
jgi:hypothetical protein